MPRRVRVKNEKFTKRAFTYQGAGGSLQDRVSYGDARARAEALALVSQPITGETNKEPLFYKSYLEQAISDFIEGGYFKALRLALKEYCNLLRELEKGGLCKR